MSGVLRVLLAEPDAMTREGIKFALKADGFVVCGEPLGAGAAVQTAVRERPDVCLIAEVLPGGAPSRWTRSTSGSRGASSSC